MKVEKLNRRADYQRFLGRSEVLRLNHCTVYRIPNGLDGFRLGLTVKAKGRSVDRNRAKRQIRESFRGSTSGQAQALGSFDYNVVVSRDKDLSYPYHKALGKELRSKLLGALEEREVGNRHRQGFKKPRPRVARHDERFVEPTGAPKSSTK